MTQLKDLRLVIFKFNFFKKNKKYKIDARILKIFMNMAQTLYLIIMEQ